MKVLSIINNGFEETEAIAVFDILRRAGIALDIASYDTLVKGAHDMVFKTSLSINEVNVEDYDLFYLPGGPQWKFNKSDKKILEILKYFTEEKIVALICASPTILGSLGYLKGKNYTCFPPMNEDFGGNFTGNKVEKDGNILTGMSAGSSLEFGFLIVETILGKEKAEDIKKSMYY